MHQNTLLHKDPVQERIVTAVCDHFVISEDELRAGNKFNIIYMRWICFYLAKKNTFLSVETIGERLGKKRPAVYNAIENIIVRKKIYVQTVYDLKKIAEKAGISDF